MKTSEKITIGIVIFLSIILGTCVTYIGWHEKSPIMMWYFPVLGSLLLSYWIPVTARRLYTDWRHREHLWLESTGVLSFVKSAGVEEEALRIITDERASHAQKLQALSELKSRSTEWKDVSGVVCGEEVAGVAEGMKITVTVSRPETAKAF